MGKKWCLGALGAEMIPASACATAAGLAGWSPMAEQTPLAVGIGVPTTTPIAFVYGKTLYLVFSGEDIFSVYQATLIVTEA